MVQQVIQQQMALMAQQLALLGAQAAMPAAAVQSVAATPAPVRSTRVTGERLRTVTFQRVAVWSIDAGEVRIDPYAPMSARARTALEQDGRRAREFLGLGVGAG